MATTKKSSSSAATLNNPWVGTYFFPFLAAAMIIAPKAIHHHALFPTLNLPWKHAATQTVTKPPLPAVANAAPLVASTPELPAETIHLVIPPNASTKQGVAVVPPTLTRHLAQDTRMQSVFIPYTLAGAMSPTTEELMGPMERPEDPALARSSFSLLYPAKKPFSFDRKAFSPVPPNLVSQILLQSFGKQGPKTAFAKEEVPRLTDDFFRSLAEGRLTQDKIDFIQRTSRITDVPAEIILLGYYLEKGFDNKTNVKANGSPSVNGPYQYTVPTLAEGLALHGDELLEILRLTKDFHFEHFNFAKQRQMSNLAWAIDILQGCQGRIGDLPNFNTQKLIKKYVQDMTESTQVCAVVFALTTKEYQEKSWAIPSPNETQKLMQQVGYYVGHVMGPPTFTSIVEDKKAGQRPVEDYINQDNVRRFCTHPGSLQNVLNGTAEVHRGLLVPLANAVFTYGLGNVVSYWNNRQIQVQTASATNRQLKQG